MVEVLNSKTVTYDKKSRVAELCAHTKWTTDFNQIKTPFGVYSTMITSDPKDVAAYKKNGFKFKKSKYYFVRIMNKKGKCVTVLGACNKLSQASKQFIKLKK